MRQIRDFDIFDTYLPPKFQPFSAVFSRFQPFQPFNQDGATYLPLQVCRTLLPYPRKIRNPGAAGIRTHARVRAARAAWVYHAAVHESSCARTFRGSARGRDRAEDRVDYIGVKLCYQAWAVFAVKRRGAGTLPCCSGRGRTAASGA